MDKEYDNQIKMTVQGRKNRISIGRSVIKALGCPEHISLKVSDTNDAISVFPCDEKDTMAFKVPPHLFTNHHVMVEIYSKKFVHGIMEFNNMDVSETYVLSGEYIKERNTAVFSLVENIELKPLNKNNTHVESK